MYTQDQYLHEMDLHLLKVVQFLLLLNHLGIFDAFLLVKSVSTPK